MSKLIIINGAPATGKTHLTRWLSARTGLPALGKDDIKEFMFDALGYSDRDWSRILGRASTEMLYVFARECLIEGRSVIIENAFWPEYAGATLASLAAELHADCIEVYCQSDEEVRMQRFRNRQESGERHPGHIDNLATMRDVTGYSPLGVGRTVTVDTTHLTETTFEEVYMQVMEGAIHA